MKSVVPVIFATDDQFASGCSVAIASMIANCDKARPYQVYIFYDVLSTENIKKLSHMGAENVTVEMVKVSRYVDRELLYANQTRTVSAYFRLFAADVLTQYDRALYLDSDIVVLGDVGELFDMDIGDNLLGGVVIFHNKPSEIEQQTEYLRKTLDLSPEQFFNSGVLSMNLKLFRDEGTMEKCLVFLREHRQLHWMEQDVLNGVCKDRVYNLPEKWNRSQFYVEDDLAERGAIGDTLIIHYLTDCKPWLVPFRRSHFYFYQYVILTPYKDELTQRLLENNAPAKTSRERILNRVKNLFFQGNTTPIHLFWYAKCWLWGKIRRFIRKLCRV